MARNLQGKRIFYTKEGGIKVMSSDEALIKEIKKEAREKYGAYSSGKDFDTAIRREIKKTTLSYHKLSPIKLPKKFTGRGEAKTGMYITRPPTTSEKSLFFNEAAYKKMAEKVIKELPKKQIGGILEEIGKEGQVLPFSSAVKIYKQSKIERDLKKALKGKELVKKKY